MNSQTRILIAVVLCVLIWLVSERWLLPQRPDGSNAQVGQTTGQVQREPSELPADAPKLEPLNGDDAVPTNDVAESGQASEPTRVRIANDWIALDVSNRGGVIAGTELLAERFARGGIARTFLQLDDASTLEVGFSEDSTIAWPRTVTLELVTADEHQVTLSKRVRDVDVTHTLALLDEYQATLTVELVNHGKRPHEHRMWVRTRFGEGKDRSQYDVHRGLCRTSEDLEAADMSDVEDGAQRFDGPVLWGGVDSKYFLQAVVPQVPGAVCEISASDDQRFLVTTLSSPRVTVQPGHTHRHVFGIYLGPKELERLQTFSAVTAEGVDLEDAIDWGWFGGLSRALGRLMLHLMRWFHELTGTWGVAILLLTVVVKLVTLPLTLKQMHSMKRMREIQPELDQIKKKYDQDRTRQAQEVQALFARSGVNPLAGCLPILIQLPIWFALYSMLNAAPELLLERFLWLPDLTKQDPYFILPLAIGGLMMLQNRMMPSAMDPAQQKMMNWAMPIMFTLFMLFLPSGLGVYIFANMALSIIQTALQVRPAPVKATT